MSDFSRIHVIQSFLVIFGHFCRDTKTVTVWRIYTYIAHTAIRNEFFLFCLLYLIQLDQVYLNDECLKK